MTLSAWIAVLRLRLIVGVTAAAIAMTVLTGGTRIALPALSGGSFSAPLALVLPLVPVVVALGALRNPLAPLEAISRRRVTLPRSLVLAGVAVLMAIGGLAGAELRMTIARNSMVLGALAICFARCAPRLGGTLLALVVLVGFSLAGSTRGAWWSDALLEPSARRGELGLAMAFLVGACVAFGWARLGLRRRSS